jgi:hypothetical protein
MIAGLEGPSFLHPADSDCSISFGAPDREQLAFLMKKEVQYVETFASCAAVMLKCFALNVLPKAPPCP